VAHFSGFVSHKTPDKNPAIITGKIEPFFIMYYRIVEITINTLIFSRGKTGLITRLMNIIKNYGVETPVL
jgi:hypothetical protein